MYNLKFNKTVEKVPVYFILLPKHYYDVKNCYFT